MHVFRPDLHFEGLTVRPNHGSMKGLIKVRARDCYKIFDPSGYGPPGVVNDSQDGVAIFYAVGNDADCQEVINLVDSDVLPLELLPNAVEALDPPFDAGWNGILLHFNFNLGSHFGQEFLTNLTSAFNRCFDFPES